MELTFSEYYLQLVAPDDDDRNKMKKIAVITGASSGMGRRFAETVREFGVFDEIWAIARRLDRLEELKETAPFPVRPIALDLTDPASFDTYASLLKEESAEVGLLVNASGYGKFDAVEKLSMEDDLGMIDLNCRALTAMTKLVLPYMHNGGRIIEIASVAAFQPIPYINVYGASKAFVLSFSRALNREVKKRGIQVLALCPFWTKTAFFDRAVRFVNMGTGLKIAIRIITEFFVIILKIPCCNTCHVIGCEPRRIHNVSLDGPDRGSVTVQAGILQMKVRTADISAIVEEDRKKKPERTVSQDKGVRAGSFGKAQTISASVDLRGMNTEEALSAVDKYLDDAYLAGLDKVTVIHGKGTGVLRREVQKYLKRRQQVQSFRLGSFGEGDAGVTIVELKKQ